ncbi:hypothetical protein [Desulfobacula sp.]|uniref:hypothetical protein n=1 Tax=Desulfobacula sp. TaxID=2593537 RepID=UPI002614AF2E|nr:hypothetical protein [Desulfobacula sp.]
MKSRVFFLCAVFLGGLLVSACQEEREKNDYSGFSKLIAERNKARHKGVENSLENKESSKKTSTNNTGSSTSSSTEKKEKLSSIILYQEDVKIVGSKSQRTLAKGVAYLNKQGQIVRIRILKE